MKATQRHGSSLVIIISARRPADGSFIQAGAPARTGGGLTGRRIWVVTGRSHAGCTQVPPKWHARPPC